MNNRYSILRNIFLLTLSLYAAMPAGAWSKKGHQITASIAQNHLTSATYYAIRDLLNGDNIVYIASWLDNARYEDEYAYTSTWHYINVDANETYDTRYHNPSGDAVSAIEWAYETLEDPGHDKDERALAVKVIVHCVGDLHQPLHCGHRSDSGGNSVYIYYNGERKSLHSYWDYNIVEDAHNWSYYQWSKNIDGLPQNVQDAYTAGTVDDWARENVDVASAVYKYFPKNKTITDADLEYWTEPVEEQFQKGGLRLALLLNKALDPSFTSAPLIDTDRSEAASAVDVYNISGTCIMRSSSAAEALRTLAPGFYIIGGRKYMVK